MNFSVPAPRIVTWPALQFLLFCRSIYYFSFRVFICEPLFKAYCTRFGRNLHTGVSLPWIEGDGQLVIGDGVTFSGKFTLIFSSRHSVDPTLTIGSRTFIGHDCQFSVGKGVSIGEDCKVASSVHFFDMSGHPTDPIDRLANLPTPDDKVSPITLGDNVWIGTGAAICPGVTIGRGSVIGAYAVVTHDVGPDMLVAGNPAREIRKLTDGIGDERSWPESTMALTGQPESVPPSHQLKARRSG